LNNINRITSLAVDIIKRLIKIEFKIDAYLIFLTIVRNLVTECNGFL